MKAPVKKWEARPISPTCEVLFGGVYCGQPTDFAYPAMRCGFMALCSDHAQRHHPHVIAIEELIKKGEKFA